MNGTASIVEHLPPDEDWEIIETESIADHLSPEEVRMRIQLIAGSLKMQKWLVIYNAIIDPRPISEIARHTGLSEAGVQRIIDEYNRIGPEAI